MEAIDQLIEDYQRRLNTINNMLKVSQLSYTKERLITKASCYRAFITELESLKKDINGSN